jgi:hypothetical protein
MISRAGYKQFTQEVHHVEPSFETRSIPLVDISSPSPNTGD